MPKGKKTVAVEVSKAERAALKALAAEVSSNRESVNEGLQAAWDEFQKTRLNLLRPSRELATRFRAAFPGKSTIVMPEGQDDIDLRAISKDKGEGGAESRYEKTLAKLPVSSTRTPDGECPEFPSVGVVKSYYTDPSETLASNNDKEPAGVDLFADDDDDSDDSED